MRWEAPLWRIEAIERGHRRLGENADGCVLWLTSTVDAEEAQRLAEAELATGDQRHGPTVTSVRRISRTWVVFWNSRLFVETGDEMQMLGGNAPLMVSDDGRVGVAGTAQPTGFYVAEFEGLDPV